MYEMFSATATVGLSRALTPTLSSPGRILVIIAMYLGRIGPISMALFFNNGINDRNLISYAKGRFYVG
jgi:trk system potassium uptake protein TrkH